jgi:hypothetical protein
MGNRSRVLGHVVFQCEPPRSFLNNAVMEPCSEMKNMWYILAKIGFVLSLANYASGYAAGTTYMAWPPT